MERRDSKFGPVGCDTIRYGGWVQALSSVYLIKVYSHNILNS